MGTLSFKAHTKFKSGLSRSSTLCRQVCEEGVPPDGQTAFPSSAVAQGVLLIPVSGREVGVVCGGEEQNDEKVSSTPRSVLCKML